MFRELTCCLAKVTKMLFVTLAPTANQKVKSFLDSHHERHRLVHRLRQDPHHFPAFGRVLADENDKLGLQPIPSCQNRWIADWRRIVWFIWHYAFPPFGLSNQRRMSFARLFFIPTVICRSRAQNITDQPQTPSF